MIKENTLDKFIGIKILEKRRDLGILQLELAKKSGLDVKTIRYYEYGKSKILAGNFVKICDILGIIPSKLFEEFEEFRKKQSETV